MCQSLHEMREKFTSQVLTSECEYGSVINFFDIYEAHHNYDQMSH